MALFTKVYLLTLLLRMFELTLYTLKDTNTTDLELGDYGFEMLDMPDMTALPWVPASQAGDEQGSTSIYVPPGVQALIDSESCTMPQPYIPRFVVYNTVVDDNIMWRRHEARPPMRIFSTPKGRNSLCRRTQASACGRKHGAVTEAPQYADLIGRGCGRS